MTWWLRIARQAVASHESGVTFIPSDECSRRLRREDRLEIMRISFHGESR